jgi:hypothetical protein
MMARTPYPVRSLTTQNAARQHSTKDLLSRVIRVFRAVVPGRAKKTIDVLSERLPRLHEGGASSLGPILGMMVESIELAPEREPELVAKLMVSYRAAKERQKQLEGPYLPGGDWKVLLESQWGTYREAINRADVPAVAALLRNFFRNDGISGFWGGSRMFETFVALEGAESLGRADLMRRQVEAWRAAWPGAPVAELDAPRIGNPWGYLVEEALLYEPVCEYHHQARHFANLLSEVSAPVVLEIGGGFGGLGYQIARRIPGVRYLGFDLPENVLLQSYYLLCAFPGARVLTYDAGLATVRRETLADYDFVLLPNFMLPEVESSSADLVVNVRSLSEMPVETIDEYHRQIDRLGRLFFFHENIFKDRSDGWYGTPSTRFPALENFVRVAKSESIWPRYQRDSGYPCHENLYIRRSVLRR